MKKQRFQHLKHKTTKVSYSPLSSHHDPVDFSFEIYPHEFFNSIKTSFIRVGETRKIIIFTKYLLALKILKILFDNILQWIRKRNRNLHFEYDFNFFSRLSSKCSMFRAVFCFLKSVIIASMPLRDV